MFATTWRRNLIISAPGDIGGSRVTLYSIQYKFEAQSSSSISGSSESFSPTYVSSGDESIANSEHFGSQSQSFFDEEIEHWVSDSPNERSPFRFDIDDCEQSEEDSIVSCESGLPPSNELNRPVHRCDMVDNDKTFPNRLRLGEYLFEYSRLAKHAKIWLSDMHLGPGRSPVLPKGEPLTWFWRHQIAIIGALPIEDDFTVSSDTFTLSHKPEWRDVIDYMLMEGTKRMFPRGMSPLVDRSLCMSELLASRKSVPAVIYFPHQSSDEGGVVSTPDEQTRIIGKTVDLLRELERSAQVNLTDKVMRDIEGAVLLFINLQGCSTAASFISGIMLFVGRYCNSSLFKTVNDYVGDMFKFTSQSEEKTTVRGWIEMLQYARENWQLVRECKLFPHFSKLLGLLVVLGLCEATDLKFSVKEFTVWEPNMEVVHGKAFDVVDAAFSTVIYFVETIALCWEQGSLKPLLVGDRFAADVDEEFTNLCNWWVLVKNGNLKKVANIEDHEFDNRLENLMKRIKQFRDVKTGFDRKLLSDKYNKLAAIKNDFVTLKISSGVRRAPFVVEFFGDSSQGKTTCAEQCIDAMLMSAGLSVDKSRQATYNAADKFMSSWSTDKTVLIIDDMANDKSQYVEKPPTRALIDVCNNTPFYANMADLDSKGKVFVEPELCIVTTNVKDLDAHLYSNNPYSVQRRANVVITVKAKREFQYIVDGEAQGLDPKLIRKHYKKLGTSPAFDDIWHLTLEKAVKPERPDQRATYTPLIAKIAGKKVKMENVPLRLALQCLINMFADHRADQECILERMRERRTKVTLCGVNGCVHMKGLCEKHDPCDNFDDYPDDESCSSHMSVVDEPIYDSDDDSLSSDVTNVADPPSDVQEFDKQFGEIFYYKSKFFFQILAGMVYRDIGGAGSSIENTAANLLYYKARSLYNHGDWIKLIPTPWMDTWWCKDLLLAFGQKTIRFRYNLMMGSFATFYGIGAAVIFKKYPVFSILRSTTADLPLKATALCAAVTVPSIGLGLLTYHKHVVARAERQYLDACLKRNMIGESLRQQRDEHVARFTRVFGIVGALYTMARLYRIWKNDDGTSPVIDKEVKAVDGLPVTERKDLFGNGVVKATDNTVLDKQGVLAPNAPEDISKRDAQSNVWASLTKVPLPVNDEAKTVSMDQFHNLLHKNLVVGVIKSGTRLLQVNALFVRPCVVVLPDHYFESDTVDARFYKLSPGKAACFMPCKLSKLQSWLVPRTDIRFCYTGSGGSFKGIERFLIDKEIPTLEFDLTHHTQEFEKIVSSGVATIADTSNGDAVFRGYVYQTMNKNTFSGLCGAVLTSRIKPIVLGLHLGGKDGTPVGCSGLLTLSMLKEAEKQLRSKPGVVLPGKDSVFEKQVFGIDILDDTPMHPKSPLNFLPEDTQLEYCGGCIGRGKFRTNVKVTLISEYVMDIMGEPNIYRGPKDVPEWYGWQKTLEAISRPGTQYDPMVLARAIDDYEAPLLDIFRKDMWNSCKPLTDRDNLNGIPGKKFIDAINLSTSIGFPLSGPKREYVKESAGLTDAQLDREFVPQIQAEIERCHELYKKGLRANVVAKACKKDEVLSKEKCRIFYANGIALTFLVRKYFLPIIRVLQMNPLVSECAVGVNCHGPEWEELMNHALAHKNIIGGDYGKYDQKLPSQLLLAALRVLIDCAKVCDYTDEDIQVMHTMTADLVFAYVAFNGDLVRLTQGAHISGNSLTVVLNGICGSLNLRMYYFSKVVPSDLPFRAVVNLITYGDDNIGSVREGVPFTIKGASEFLAEYGQIYTMPDKESELADYLVLDEVEFLKRKSVWHEQLECSVGALSEKSCFKMLHCYVRDPKSPLSEEMACAQNIDTALQEWFNHGKEIYELRRGQLRRVANAANIDYLCTGLDDTYEDRVKDWHDKYGDYMLYIKNSKENL